MIQEILEEFLPEAKTPIQRDININLKRLLTESALEEKERALLLLALSSTTGDVFLQDTARKILDAQEVPREWQEEAYESAAIMGMLNIYYRFKHYVGSEDYDRPNLRMTSLSKPLMGKRTFELLAFAVSVINGCQNCIASHEQVLRHEGVSVEGIHDAAKLASVVKAHSHFKR